MTTATALRAASTPPPRATALELASAASSWAAELAPGRVIGGKYRLEREIAGTRGTSWAATHLALDEKVALKVMRSDLRGDAARVARFATEAKRVARLRCEHVTHVIDVGTSASCGPYVVTEHLEGQPLSEQLRERGPLPVDRAVDYVLQACVGLATAHSRGVIHGNVSPARLFVTRRGRLEVLKLMDFCAAQPASRGGGWFEDAAAGSLEEASYASPEQICGERPMDARSDVWSLGAVLRELVTAGKTGEATPVATPRAATGSDEPPESGRRLVRRPAPVGPPELQRVIERCLASAPGDRFQTVAQLAEALMPFSLAGSVIHVHRACSILREPLTSPVPAEFAFVVPQRAATRARPSPRRESSEGRAARWFAYLAASTLVVVLISARPGAESALSPAARADSTSASPRVNETQMSVSVDPSGATVARAPSEWAAGSQPPISGPEAQPPRRPAPGRGGSAHHVLRFSRNPKPAARTGQSARRRARGPRTAASAALAASSRQESAPRRSPPKPRVRRVDRRQRVRLLGQ